MAFIPRGLTEVGNLRTQSASFIYCTYTHLLCGLLTVLVVTKTDMVL